MLAPKRSPVRVWSWYWTSYWQEMRERASLCGATAQLGVMGSWMGGAHYL